jgi:hypothetical protein
MIAREKLAGQAHQTRPEVARAVVLVAQAIL